VRPDPRAREVR